MSLSKPPSGIQAAANVVPGRPCIDAFSAHNLKERQQYLPIARLKRAPTPREKYKRSSPKKKTMAAVLDDVNLERGLRATMTRDASTGRVPVIDMSADDAGARMWDAATTVGFFTVVNHGVDEETISAGFAASRAFFAQDQGEKERQSPFAPRLNSGYEYMTQVRPSTGTADRKESLQITAREGAMDGRWPATPATFEADARALLGASRGLAARILDLLEPRARPDLAPGTLSGSHALWGAGGQCCLRLLHYPPADAVAADDATTWRAGPHTDWCCVTLLYQRPGNEGLECAANPRGGAAQASWLRVDPVAGGVAVNVGDMLSRWADGRVLSNLHRVRMPATAAECARSRYSVAFFMQADREAVIASKGGAITAGDYILGRIKSNFAEAN